MKQITWREAEIITNRRLDRRLTYFLCLDRVYIYDWGNMQTGNKVTVYRPLMASDLAH